MQHRHSELRTCQLPPAHSILKRVFNTPEKVKELALACGVKTTHVHKWLRGGESSAPSDLDRLCKVIFLAATFGEEGISGAGLIADYVREYFLTIVEQSATPYADEQDRVSNSPSCCARRPTQSTRWCRVCHLPKPSTNWSSCATRPKRSSTA